MPSFARMAWEVLALVEQSFWDEKPHARHRGTEQDQAVKFLVNRMGGRTRLEFCSDGRASTLGRYSC
jgi:hypothetical protein